MFGFGLNEKQVCLLPLFSTSSSIMTARSSSRKRSLDNDRIENDNNVEEETPFLDLGDEPAVALNSIKITPKQREIDKFNGLTVDAQQACVSAVARLFIFKGTSPVVAAFSPITCVFAKALNKSR